MNDNTFKHGTGGYTNHKCRCDVCMKASRDYSRKKRAENPNTPGDHSSDLTFMHGTHYGYNYHKCRCKLCASKRSESKRKYYYLNSGRLTPQKRQHTAASRAATAERRRLYELKRTRNQSKAELEVRAARQRNYYAATAGQAASRKRSTNAKSRSHATRVRARWTVAEDLIAVDVTLSLKERAAMLSRTVEAVNRRRYLLGKKAMA